MALRGASRAELLKAGRLQFAGVFSDPLFDGRHPDPGKAVLDYRGATGALVKDAGGRKLLLKSTLPLQAPAANGELAPVDLSLRESTQAFTTTNSNAGVQIFKDPARGISFLNEDFSVSDATATGGAQPDGVQTDGRVFFDQAAGGDSDVSFIVVPKPTGVQVGWLLGTADAPQTYKLNLDLPEGARVRRTQTDDPIPGDPPRTFEIVDRDGKSLAYITPPMTVDSDGVNVESSMHVVGRDRLVVGVKHHGEDLRYPLFVDPELIPVPRGRWGGDWQGWGTYQTPTTPTRVASDYNHNYYGWALDHPAYNPSGAYMSMPTNTWFDIGTGRGFEYRAPAGTYISQATFGNISHAAIWGTGSYNMWWWGILNAARNAWQNVSSSYASGSVGASAMSAGGASEQNYANIGIGATAANYQGRLWSGNLSAWVKMDWANVYLGDPHPPQLTSARPANENWSTATTRTRTVSASDPGSGMVTFRLTGPGIDQTTPLSYGEAQNIHYTPAEGSHEYTLTAIDAVGNTSSPHTWTEKIDRTAPAISPSGALYDRRDTTLSPGSYQLHIEARDGDAATNASRRSGVTRVTTTIDGDTVDSFDAACPLDSCAVARDVTFKTSDYPGGRHTLVIEAEDALGRTTTSTFYFSTPCCLEAPGTAGSSTAADRVLYGDVDGDARADAVMIDDSGGVNVALSDGQRFGTPQRWADVPPALHASTYMGDMDGDGKADLLYREPALDPLNPSVQRMHVMLSTGSAFAAASNWGAWSSGYDTRLADVDGDGADDLIGRASATGEVDVAYSLEDRLADAQVWATIPSSSQWAAADPNGDGYDDLVVRDPSTGAVTVRASDSGSFEAPAPWATVAGSAPVLYGDLDGNLAADLVTRDPADGAVRVGASNRQTFAPLTGWGTVASGDVQIDLADIDGDTRADILTRNKITGVITASRSDVVTPVNEEPAFVPDPTVGYDDAGSGGPSLRSVADAPGPTMKLAWADEPLLVGARSGPVAFNAADPERARRAIIRMKQAGATSARLIVYWGIWVNRNAEYKAAIAAAVTRLNEQGMKVYMTLTGAWYDDKIGANPTSLNPDSVDFGAFVTQVVNTFLPMGVQDYAMWNEPNLPAHPPNPPQFLERVRCANGKRLTTAKLYQGLYRQGYAAARAAADALSGSVRVYLGEFSEQHNVGYAECDDAKRSTLTLFEYLEEVVSDPPGDPMRTSGVAWHPYQSLHPSDADMTRVGIGRIGGMRTIVQRLAKEGKLRTGSGNAPRLYLTEFGYFNRPHALKSAYFSERTRASRLDVVLKRARSGSPDPGMFVFYLLQEAWPDELDASPDANPNPDPLPESAVRAKSNFGDFDTGFINPVNLDVTGTRPYGQGDAGQPRSAYCAIRTYAKVRGYPILGPQPELPNNCP